MINMLENIERGFIMVYPEFDYIIKFYDGFTLVYQLEIEANNSKEAVETALKNTKGLVSFNKIRIINLG